MSAYCCDYAELLWTTVRLLEMWTASTTFDRDRESSKTTIIVCSFGWWFCESNFRSSNWWWSMVAFSNFRSPAGNFWGFPSFDAQRADATLAFSGLCGIPFLTYRIAWSESEIQHLKFSIWRSQQPKLKLERCQTFSAIIALTIFRFKSTRLSGTC